MMPHNFNKLKILRMCNTLLAMNLVLFTTALIKSQLLITHAFSSFEDTSMLLLLLLLRRRLCLARIASPDAALLLLLLLLLHQLASLSSASNNACMSSSSEWGPRNIIFKWVRFSM